MYEIKIIKKLLLSGACITAVLLLPCFLSGYAFAASADSVEISKLEMTVRHVALKTAQDKTLNVSLSPGKADGNSITWKSSDNSVVTVKSTSGSKAVIRAVGEGKAAITAASPSGKTAVCYVTVSDDEVEVSRLEMITETATIRVNQRKTLSVEVFPRNADDKAVGWLSDNAAVVDVEEDGSLVGISPGTAKITAMSSNGKTAVCTVTVTASAMAESGRQEPASGDSLLDPSVNDTETSISGNISMTIGQEKDLSESIKYKELYKDSNGEWRAEWSLDGTVSWASAFPDVASVNDRGVVLAHRAGTTKITATGRNGITGKKHVQTIIVGVSRGISSPANSFEVSEGGRLDLSQIGALHSGAKNIKWTSSVADIASVDSAGLVSARSIGRCTVTAAYTDENSTGQTIQYQLRVTAGMLGNKTKKSTIILTVGDKIDAGKMYYSNNQNLPNVLNQYSCTTGAKNVLSADGLSVSAKAAGTATVSILHADGTICHKLTVVVK